MASGVAEPTVARPERLTPTYWGLAGGLWATASFAVTAVLTAASDNDDRTLYAAIYGVLALVFVPAIVFSLISSPRRNTVLRVETALCLVVAVVSIFVFDPGLPLLLAPATFLLATGAGITFAANKPKAER